MRFKGGRPPGGRLGAPLLLAGEGRPHLRLRGAWSNWAQESFNCACALAAALLGLKGQAQGQTDSWVLFILSDTWQPFPLT